MTDERVEIRGQFERAVDFIERHLGTPDNWQAVLLAFMRMCDNAEAERDQLREERDELRRFVSFSSAKSLGIERDRYRAALEVLATSDHFDGATQGYAKNVLCAAAESSLDSNNEPEHISEVCTRDEHDDCMLPGCVCVCHRANALDPTEAPPERPHDE